MVTAGVVDVDPRTLRFSLPPEHAAFLTRAAATDNIAVFAQYIALLGGVEDDIVECFKNGGGVPYHRFPRFHAVMAEDSGQSVLSSLESHILPLVPGLADQLARGIRTLDVGCGQGRIMIRLAELFPNSSFVGMDLSGEAIAAAGSEVLAKGLRNIEFVAIDLSDFHERAEPESLAFITTFDAVHDQAAPLNVLEGIHRALMRDGVYLMQDIKASSHVYNQCRPPDQHVPLCSVVHALHDGVPGAGWGGTGRHVGRGEDARVPRACRLVFLALCCARCSPHLPARRAPFKPSGLFSVVAMLHTGGDVGQVGVLTWLAWA